ncbi:MAG: hypothetical protein H6R01_531 [Burkholderiaceae bacterium]|nr:hypothetical protein [Burkholderiaceae bacterium]
MNRTERLYRIDDLLTQRKVVTVETFLDELEISRATFKRDLEYLRDRLQAPIIWDRDAGGYRYEQLPASKKFELPGLWFNASEIHALLTMQQLLGSLSPGLLTPHIEPLMARLRMLLDSEGIPATDIEKRIRIQKLHARPYEPQHFIPIANAVLQRKRIAIEHHSKFDGKQTSREISPQRLTHYRENWYLDAWCHLREEIRSFSLDAILAVTPTEKNAKEVTAKVLKEVLDAGYGIYSGKNVQWAELAFTPERAKWISKETWHPEQQGWYAEDGTYHLKVPYSDERELCADILRHVPEVRVVGADGLKKRILALLHEGIKRQDAQ